MNGEPKNKWAGSAPSHNLCVKRSLKSEEKFHQIGCGWENERGGIRLRLDVGVTLNWKECEGLMLMLFPRPKEEKEG